MANEAQSVKEEKTRISFYVNEVPFGLSTNEGYRFYASIGERLPDRSDRIPHATYQRKTEFSGQERAVVEGLARIIAENLAKGGIGIGDIDFQTVPDSELRLAYPAGGQRDIGLSKEQILEFEKMVRAYLPNGGQ